MIYQVVKETHFNGKVEQYEIKVFHREYLAINYFISLKTEIKKSKELEYNPTGELELQYYKKSDVGYDKYKIFIIKVIIAIFHDDSSDILI